MIRKGFTLLEIAVVLVLIGLIIGAVLKGQDLILNAQAKKFVTHVRQGEVSQWTFFDRNGRFAGDGDGDGIFGNENGNEREDANAVLKKTLSTYDSVVQLGDASYHLKYGTYPALPDGSRNANVVVVTKVEGNVKNKNFNNAVWEGRDLEFAKSLDVSVDGSIGLGKGRVFALAGPIKNDGGHSTGTLDKNGLSQARIVNANQWDNYGITGVMLVLGR